MAATVAGIIFSNLHDNNIPELTRLRTMASVPFGCRYRLIDFALSNMVNAGITDVNVVTHNNYNSLMDHVGSGKDWDLARRSGGLRILPPFISSTSKDSQLFSTRLEALCSIEDVIERMKADYIVMSDCDGICNVDIAAMVAEHVKSGAVITYAIAKIALSEEKVRHETLVETNDEGYITNFIMYPEETEGEYDALMNVSVVDRNLLLEIIHQAKAKKFKHLLADVLIHMLPANKVRYYRYDGFYSDITSMADYYKCNMSILEKENRDALFAVKGRPILTKVRNSAPTKYAEGSVVKNSMIADGCIIEGTVENSILFRGVKVGKGTTIKNCVLFQDVKTGENVFLNCVIADKNAQVDDNVMLSGHSTVPFYIEKRRVIKDR